MHFFCKKHPFYFAGSQNLCTFVLILKVTYKDNAAASLSSYQETIINLNIISNSELSDTKSMLNAAALTYVASLITTLLQIIRLALISLGRRRD